MINYLLNCDKTTPLGMVPGIINHNNLAINDEFAWIYDVSTDRLIRSVYSPKGSVKAHKGEFVNLSCEYLTVKNVNALLTYILSAVDDIVLENVGYHNVLQGRFSNSYAGSEDSYCHDADSIVYEDNKTVYDVLNDIDQGNVNIKYGDKIYTGAEIAALINWKNNLQTKSLTINGITYLVLCER